MLDNLYENIGGKIKGLAKFIFVIEAIGAIIAGTLFMFNNPNLTFVGFLILALGTIAAWVSSWVLYAFGELVEKTCDNESNNYYIAKQINEINENVKLLANPMVREAEKTSKHKVEEKIEEIADINLKKAVQCECGELHYAMYCPVCGKKSPKQ